MPNKQRLLPHLPLHTQTQTHTSTHTQIVCVNYGINGQGPHVDSARLAPSSYAAQTDDNNINRKCWHIKNKSMPLCLYQLPRERERGRESDGYIGLVSTISCTCCRVEVIKKICPFQRVAQTQQFGGDLMPGQLFVIIVPPLSPPLSRSLSLSGSLTHSTLLTLSLSLPVEHLALCLTLDGA